MINIYVKYKYTSAPGALSTLATSVNLSSLTQATLMSPGKHKTCACRYTLWICSLSTLENTDKNKNLRAWQDLKFGRGVAGKEGVGDFFQGGLQFSHKK